MSHCFSPKRQKGNFKSAFLKLYYGGLTSLLLSEMPKYHNRTKDVLFSRRSLGILEEGVKVTSQLLSFKSPSDLRKLNGGS